MKKNIEFEIKNGAYYPKDIHQQISDKIVNTLIPETRNTNWSIYNHVRGEMLSALADFKLDNYYMGLDGKGAKVTKIIKKILLARFVKELVIKKFPVLCKKIAELYTPRMELKAYWGDKKLLGSGIWENGSTCFSSGGCNDISRRFLVRFNRAQVLVLKNEKNTARCIAFFAGGRNIYLTNFYYNGLPYNKLLFVEALRRILGIDKISYKKREFPLPIYFNGDGILCYTEKSSAFNGQYMYPCPQCETKITHLYTYVDGDTYHIGCSKECAGECERCCDRCGYIIYDDDYYMAPNDERYCESCYHDNVFYCEGCNFDRWQHDHIGNSLCEDCGAVCEECNEVTPNSQINNDVCEDCLEEKEDTEKQGEV